MGLSDIIERIKSVFGMGGSGRRRQRQRGGQPRQEGQGQTPAQGQQPQQQDEGEQHRAARRTEHQRGTPRPTGPETDYDPQRRQAETDGVDVTVERDPDTQSEDAVKGTETSGEPVTESIASDEAQNGTGGTDDGSEESSAQTTRGTGEPIDVIKGIGPTYAERLAEAGVETVADLAESDPDDLAERADNVPGGRLETWIERARHRD